MPAHLGAVASSGIGIGPAYQFKHLSLECRLYQPVDASSEWARFEASLSASRQKLQLAYEKAAHELGADDAAIFKAHLTILHDPDLLAGTREKIIERKTNAEAAIFDVSESYCQHLKAFQDEHIRARAADIRDVRDGILPRLLAMEEDLAGNPSTPAIVTSRFLMPSDCNDMESKMILGSCTAEGGATSHVAILAKSLGVPALTGMDEVRRLARVALELEAAEQVRELVRRRLPDLADDFRAYVQ